MRAVKGRRGVRSVMNTVMFGPVGSLREFILPKQPLSPPVARKRYRQSGMGVFYRYGGKAYPYASTRQIQRQQRQYRKRQHKLVQMALDPVERLTGSGSEQREVLTNYQKFIDKELSKMIVKPVLLR